MFINGQGGHNRDGEQTARGDFLMVFRKDSGGELRAAVRHVRMRQCGHWMTGSVKVGKYSHTLSGSYGSDGLPMSATRQEPRTCWHQSHPDFWTEQVYTWEDVPTVNWDSLVSLPEDLQKEFWHPEHQGHNSAGSEARNLRSWARENIIVLKKAGK